MRVTAYLKVWTLLNLETHLAPGFQIRDCIPYTKCLNQGLARSKSLLLVGIRGVNMLFYPSQYLSHNGYHVNIYWFIHVTTLDRGPAVWASFCHRKTDMAGSHDWKEPRPQSFNSLSFSTSKSIYFSCYSLLFKTMRASLGWVFGGG